VRVFGVGIRLLMREGRKLMKESRIGRSTIPTPIQSGQTNDVG
jgi:hypothetical protein